MNRFFDYIFTEVEDPSGLLQNVLISFLVIICAFLLTKWIHYLVDKYLPSKTVFQFSIHLLRTIMIILALYLIARVWFEDGVALAIIFFSLIFFIGLAVKDLVLDISGYAYILLRKPFKMGDYIEFHGVTGRVVDLDFMQINIEEIGAITDTHGPSGRYVSIPNRLIFEEPTYNYTHGHRFIIQEVDILISFDADRNKALKIAGHVAYEEHLKIMAKYSEEDMQIFDKILESTEQSKKPTIRAILDPNGFRIYIRYFTGFEHIDLHNNLIRNRLYDEFKNKGVEMPVPLYYRMEK